MATTSRRGAKLVDFDLMAIKAALAQQESNKAPVEQPVETPVEQNPLPPEPKKGKNAKATQE
jgi:hypothetical protein